MKKNYAKKEAKDYKNIARRMFYFLVTKVYYRAIFKVIYRLEIHGKENVPKNNQFIVAPNHLSTLDPPLIASVLPINTSFMAKKELFDIPIMKIVLDYLGAFAVDREHLSPSTIKTAKAICKTDWVLGLFPEGTRGVAGTISAINKGFATLAKATKCGILPIGITGTQKTKFIPFSGKVIVNIGELIPFNEDINVMVEQWIESIQKLTGYTYAGAQGT